jgi:hypothetical protein
MQALRLAFGLFFSVIGLLGYLAFDFTITNRAITAGGGEPMGFFQYTKGWVSFAGMLAEDGDADGAEPVPEALVAMMPRAPAGWSVRATAEDDAAPFVPDDLKGEALDIVLAAVTPNIGRGVERAAQTYQSGAKVVVVELVRYPDIIFSSFMGMANKFELRMATMQVGNRGFMTVRGLEIVEATLPETASARVFAADVGGQIHLRVLAPKTMNDQDLLPFFETLHVPAMNADVVEKVAGLGDVPVIVLASAIDAETRKAHEDEREAERQKIEEEQAATEAALATEQKAAEDAARGITTDAETGVKTRRGASEGGGVLLGEKTKSLGDGCEMQGSRKVCGTGQPDED